MTTTATGAHCPHCGAEFIADLCDGHGDLVTYWGEGDPVAVYCTNEDCEREFKIEETVVRTWETAVPKVTITLDDDAEPTFAETNPASAAALVNAVRSMREEDGT